MKNIKNDENDDVENDDDENIKNCCVYSMWSQDILVITIQNDKSKGGDFEPTVVCLQRVRLQNAWRLGAVRFVSSYA